MSKSLSTLSFEQIARLNHQKRTEYIGLMRKAALDLDKIQRSFKGLHVVAAHESQKGELYAEAIEALLGAEAFAQSSNRNQCIYALNLSQYPEDQVKDGRAPFQCLLVECDYGRRIKGVRCGFVASGLINKSDVGCLPIEKATNAIDKTHASQACWDQRTQLANRNKSSVDQLISNSNQYFGFVQNGTYNSNTCKTTQARDYINGLINRSYSDQAYAQLVKIAYFCQSNGQGLPAGLLNYEGVSDALTFSQLTQDFSGLSQAAKDIFANIERHCKSPLSDSVVRDIEAGTNLRKVARGSSPYEMEVARQNYLKEARANGWTPNHANVLEVEECRHAFLTFDALNKNLQDIAGTYPRISDGAPPQVPPAPIDADIVDVEPTGCSENVARDESMLAQAAARCMPCMIQSHEARKTGQGTYRPSRKFLSLMSTMALACEDGLANDTSVNPQLMMDYWMAFGHCSSETYEWHGSEDKNLIEAWAEKKGKPKFWDGSKKDLKSASHPDRNNAFSRNYGISLEEAKKLFCDPSGREYDYTSSSGEKARFLKTRREQFNQQKEVIGRSASVSVADNLLSCMNEASANAARFHQGSNMCYAFTAASDAQSPAFKSAQSDWLNDGFPTVLNRGGACYIAKQTEKYRVCDATSSVCKDKNRDGKDDENGCVCGGTATYLVYVEPGFANREFRVRAEARGNGQLVPDVARRPDQGSTDAEWVAYRTDNACMISAGDARRIAEPRRSTR